MLKGELDIASSNFSIRDFELVWIYASEVKP